jgi:hypothetical protein
MEYRIGQHGLTTLPDKSSDDGTALGFPHSERLALLDLLRHGVMLRQPLKESPTRTNAGR